MSMMKMITLLGLPLLLGSCGPDEKNIKHAQPNAQPKQEGGTMPTTLHHEEILVGTGESPRVGQRVTVHYVGTLPDGTQFDSSRDRGTPFSFTFGVGQVIQGWDQGLKTMKVGGRRMLIIPPHLGYGNRAAGSIPPNSTLHFEVELISIS
jgi:peptidylprolyl isomerase